MRGTRKGQDFRDEEKINCNVNQWKPMLVLNLISIMKVSQFSKDAIRLMQVVMPRIHLIN